MRYIFLRTTSRLISADVNWRIQRRRGLDTVIKFIDTEDHKHRFTEQITVERKDRQPDAEWIFTESAFQLQKKAAIFGLKLYNVHFKLSTETCNSLLLSKKYFLTHQVAASISYSAIYQITLVFVKRASRSVAIKSRRVCVIPWISILIINQQQFLDSAPNDAVRGTIWLRGNRVCIGGLQESAVSGAAAAAAAAVMWLSLQ